jgi:hypothetical protein
MEHPHPRPPFPVLIVIVILTLLAAGCTGSPTASPTAGTPAPPPLVSQPASASRSTVAAAAPYPDPEPYEISPRFVTNIAEYGEGGRPLTTFHDATYTLKYQSEALIADVVEAPLLITFTVTPGHTNPYYCFFILTVRDANSGTVVGQEGYNRAFSSETTKKMAFTMPGRYHLTLHGAMVDVRLKLQAGG